MRSQLVLAGAIPFRSAYTASLVASEGISGVVALNEPYELSLCSYQTAGWNKLGVAFLNLPTTDLFSAPNQQRLEEGVAWMIDETSSGKGSVYVHCKAGRARSAVPPLLLPTSCRS